jgi:hypothetical protein
LVTGYLSSVRFLPLGILLLTTAAFAQRSSGTYEPVNGAAVNWTINSAKTLVWGGSPYMPIGLRIDGQAGSIQAAKGAGIQDVLVELPAGGTGWTDALKLLESSSMRYLIEINSLAPMARGYAVEPQAYSIGGITQARKIEATIPGASSALTILVTKRDNNVEKVLRFPLENGRLSMDVKPLNDLEHILLIYPEIRSQEQPDLWESMDEHRDTLVTSLKRAAPGPGFRGLVNPLGRTFTLARNELRFVPNNSYFRYELRTYLEKKYRNVEVAQRSWSLSSNTLKSFDDMARLCPLWSGSKGISELWDPSTDQLIPCDMKRSTIWKDIKDVVMAAGARRYQRLTAAVRQATDVPVIQEWSGWASAYEGDAIAVDGIGARIVGQSPTQQVESACRAASTVYRWKSPGWLLATEIDAGSDASNLGSIVEDLGSLGVRGWFIRSTAPEVMKLVASVSAQKSNDPSLAAYASNPVYFPENAWNPATPQRLPGGSWWIPTPANGNRVDLGSEFAGYRLVDGASSFFAIWAVKNPVRVKLRSTKAKQLTFQSVDGTDPKPKIVKGGVEVQIGTVPLLVYGTEDIPVPETAVQETIARFGALIKLAEQRRLEFMEERYGFGDSLAGLEVNPGGSFAAMRQWYWRLGAKFADYTWLEAEFSRNHNFSETALRLGSSNSHVLSLRTSLEAYAQAYYAEYNFLGRSNADLELWIAAKIPAAARPYVSVTVGGQVLTIQGEGLSAYGDGYEWYRFGTTKAVAGTNKLRLSVDAPQGADLAIDAILLYPGSFRPNGVVPPDPIDFSAVQIRKGG